MKSLKYYSNGNRIVCLTERVYEKLYKDSGYLEIESTRYEVDSLKKMDFNDLYFTWRVVERLADKDNEVITKEEMIKALLKIDMKLKGV